jgi:hypothetical protein
VAVEVARQLEPLEILGADDLAAVFLVIAAISSCSRASLL